MASAVRTATASSSSRDEETASNSLICRYYARGMCRFGSLCRFIHRDPPRPPGTSTGSASAAGSATGGPMSSDPNKWVLAPTFVPRHNHLQQEQPGTSAASKSYADVVMGPEAAERAAAAASYTVILCPYQYNCPYGDTCEYEHNELCEMCGRYALHPTDKDKRKLHIAQCIQQHEKDMELSFAVARSKDKTCGICFEIIIEKAGREQRFGILPNCNHIFCLECIRKWRQATQFENKIIRACPECRIPSDYVCPSAFWVETKEEKEKLITDYKHALGEKDCKYFNKGEGKCPFGNKCFYKHALQSGERVDVGVPKRNKRKVQSAEDEILELFDLYLWGFVDRREFYWQEILSSLTDSEDSDWSESFD